MKEVPGSSLPSAIQLARWILDPTGFLEDNARQYGDIFGAKVSLTGEKIVFVSSPTALQQILTGDRKQFSAPGEVNRIISSLLGEYSVIMLSGEAHKKRRQLLLPPFHGERMRSYGDIIRNLTVKVMESVPLDRVFEARSVTQSLTLQVILETVFGIGEGERFQTLQGLLSEMLDGFRSPAMASILFFSWLQKDLGAWSPWGKYIRARRKIDEILFAEIAERKANPREDRTDILSLLLSARDEEGNPMSDNELRDELITLLVAGHETTATSIAWGLYWTHLYPEIKEKVRQELATLGDNPDPVEITRLPYLSAVCSESLRVHPVTMLTFPRVAEESIELDGYSIEKGTLVTGCMYLSNHREATFPDSHTFRPERFLERQFTPFEYMPFGGGARRCIGEALALFEMKIALGTILAGYDLELADKTPEKPRRRALTLSPARGVRMILKGRREAIQPSPALAEIS
ncbi:cytochrome P450 [Pannus brasiliensis CCIBt3594]|uniref:Cytochrome P450 n=1 Tax=Pannus brasiliensis CCIBt3594 TaxID=1427578 RepID=A0AAW9QF72_9CHRO